MKTSKTGKYAPVLRYMVEKQGMFISPRREGLMAGRAAWLDPDYMFDDYNSARDFAEKRGGQVIKLRIRARAEPIKGPDAPWKAPVEN